MSGNKGGKKCHNIHYLTRRPLSCPVHFQIMDSFGNSFLAPKQKTLTGGYCLQKQSQQWIFPDFGQATCLSHLSPPEDIWRHRLSQHRPERIDIRPIAVDLEDSPKLYKCLMFFPVCHQCKIVFLWCVFFVCFFLVLFPKGFPIKNSEVNGQGVILHQLILI